MAEILDIGARRQLPRWLVLMATAFAALALAAVALVSAAGPRVIDGHGSRTLHLAPVHQQTYHSPLRGHYFG